MNFDSSLGTKNGFADDAASGPGIDFARATLRTVNGMTCEGYEARYGRNRVFVKRLRPEHRGNPVIREAFAKEFEIGLGLSHRSLPGYLFAGDDYIVMHYVEGDTLAAMMEAGDRWLRDGRNLRRMLSELVDVTDYLHQNHVVHCDIKPDNVMLTRGARCAMLIDLGEAYTDWLDRTSGDVGRYGLDSLADKGHPSADFRALGLLVDRLNDAGFPARGLSRFRRLCADREVSPDALRRALRPGSRHIAIVAAAAVAVVVAMTAAAAMLAPGRQTAATADASAPVRDTLVIVGEKPAGAQTPALSPAPAAAAAAQTIKPAAPAKPDYKSIIEREAEECFRNTEDALDRAERALADSTANLSTMDNLLNAFTFDMQAGYAKFELRFPDINPVDVQLAFVGTAAFQRINVRMDRAMKQVADRIEAAHSKEAGTAGETPQ